MSASRRRCDWSDSTAAYLLGALEEEERRTFEAHLHACEICRAQLAELTPSVEMLAASVERVEPPDRLRSELMAQVNAQARLMRAAEPEADAPTARPPSRGGWRRPLQLSPAWAAAAAALLLAVGGVGGALLAGDHKRGPRVISAQVRPGFAPHARAELVVGPDFARLRLRGIPQPPTGKVYQVWLMIPDRRQPQPTDVLFSIPTGGTATVAVPTVTPGAREVLVTAEPDGGSRHPTSEPILAARIN